MSYPIISKLFEGQFIEISELDTHTHILILGNMYSSPRDILFNYKSFTKELVLTHHTFKEVDIDIIIMITDGDMNIDLLKLNE